MSQTVAALVDRIRQEWPDVIAIYRFGSAGTPAETASSDVDLAVWAGSRELPAVRLFEFAQELAASVFRDVDLIDLSTAPTVMRAQIVVKGDRLYCANKTECDAFEAHILSDYARLNEERRGILEDIRQRGGIHG